MTKFRKVMTAAALVAVGAWVISALPAAANAGTEKFDKAMQPVLSKYLAIHSELAKDSSKGVSTAAKAMAIAAGKVDAKTVQGEHGAHYKDLPQKIQKAALALSKGKTLEERRTAFKELSKPMAMWGTMSKPAGIDVVFCSMAKGSWLQKRGKILNPYHGTKMLHCGSVVGGENHKPAQKAGKAKPHRH